MHPPSFTPNESERLELLQSLQVLDSPSVPALDRITRLASRLFQVPIAMVTLVDEQRQWFMSRVGLDVCETPRDESLCGHAILEASSLVVPDTLLDSRFHDNPLVVGSPHIRFYAGRPLRSKQGFALGTLCLIDRQPRAFDATDEASLNDLADMVEAWLHGLEAATQAQSAEALLKRNQLLFARTVNHAAVGIAVSTPGGCWIEVNQQFCDIVGHSREQLVGAAASDFLHPDDLEQSRAILRHVLRRQANAFQRKVRFIRADGSVSWAQMGVSLLWDEHGRVEHLITVLTDVNQQTQVQSELESLQRTLEDRIEARTNALNETLEKLKKEMAARESAQRDLSNEKERFQSTLRHATDAFIEADQHGRIVSWNLSAEKIFGWSRSEAVGRALSETIVPPPLRDEHRSAFNHFMQTGAGSLMGKRVELTGLRRNGDIFPVELTLGSSDVGGQKRANAFLHDISRRKGDEHALRESALQLKTITDNAPAMIASIDRNLRYRFHNRAYTDWFGVAAESLVGTDAREFWGPAAYEKLRPALTTVLKGKSVALEYELQALAGPKWFYAHLVPHIEEDDDIAGFYLLAQDITERKQLYQRIEHEATHDALTGLPNRRALMLRLDEAMARSRRNMRSLGVLFMDLDGFKLMNDMLGHEFGDAVLQHFASTVNSSVRETDFVARLAGDEFVVVVENLNSSADAADQAAIVATAVIQRLHVDQDVQGVTVNLAASIGIAIYAQAAEETAQELLGRADAAMYRAKAKGKRQMSV